ncbi:hypothetical protein, partial [Streptomyces sp. NPDC001274]
QDNINTMIANLRDTTATNKEQDWLKGNLARIPAEGGAIVGPRPNCPPPATVRRTGDPASGGERASVRVLRTATRTGEAVVARVNGHQHR